MSGYTLVEEVGDPDYLAEVVEDPDGFRILTVPAGSGPIPERIWARAYQAGVAMVVAGLAAISTEDYLANATWHEFAAPPTYRHLLEARQQQAHSDPLDGVRFVHLHTHTEASQLDGLSTVEEIVETIRRDPEGGGAVGSADHGNVAIHPALQDVCDKAGIKPIFGMEAYFVPDRFRRSRTWMEIDGVEVNPEHLTPEEQAKAEKKSDAVDCKTEYTHLTLWAVTPTGLRNLWAMSTESWRDGLYDGKPRLDWDTLERFSEGVVCGTGCLRGPVSVPLMAGDVHRARETLSRLHSIFADRLYIEIHCNALEDQVKVNRHLEEFSRAYRIPPLAAVDSHYAVPEHQPVHQAWLAMQTNKVLGQETSLFSGDQEYHLKTAAEVRASLAYLPPQFVFEAMENTVEIARMAQAKVGGEVTTPTYSNPSKEHPDPVQRDVERLIDVCLANWERKVVGKPDAPEVYMERMEREMQLLVSKQFCGYFLIVWDYVTWAKKEGCLVGPGRGSGGGSLVAYLADITELDPIEHHLMFERFLTEGRTSLPDFDIDFPASWRSRITGYLRDRWGEDRVANIGTFNRLRSKAAINDVRRVMEPILDYDLPYMEFEALKRLVDEADRPLAGKHLPWEEFCSQYADAVDPMAERYPEVFATINVVVDRIKTYGKHAAGVVISTEKTLDDLPMRKTVDSKTKTEVMVTQFDMVALELLGYVKFDILTLRTLDTLQETIDLVAEKFGRRLNPYDWRAEYEDPQVWGEVSAGRTLGLFQIETASGTRLTKRMQPVSVDDLAAVMTVVRPGPMRSGLTETYLRRRAGLEPITYLDPRLEPILGDTYGAAIYQEQVMAICSDLAGYTLSEADEVRSILGKKKIEKVAAAGEEFVRRAIGYGTDPEVAETLWAQMAEFAKYGFNRAHAFGYAVIGHWCAWLRFQFPVEFLLAALSTVDTDRIPEFIQDCRNSGYGIRPPDVNASKPYFTADGMDILYGLAMVKGIGWPTAEQIVSLAPYTALDDFIERCVNFSGSAVNMGHVKTLVQVGAFDSLIPNRKAVEMELERQSSGLAKRCLHMTEAPNPRHPFNLPCGFDWDHEPDPPLLPRGRGKAKTYVAKPPPKRCSVACRQYAKSPPIGPEEVIAYTSEEISKRERELLGTWITHSPFAAIPASVLTAADCATAQMIEAGSAGQSWEGIGMVEAVKKRTDVHGRAYAFVKINLQDGEIEAICFADNWEKYGSEIVPDRLGVALISKTPRGYQLPMFQAIN